MTLATNQSRLRRWGFLTDTSPGYGANTEAAYTLALDKLEQLMPLPAGAAPTAPNELSLRGAAEIVSHEDIVLEMYKDSVGVSTWGPGITTASGHGVERYKDNPQTLERVLEVFMWLIKTKYLPEVLKAFAGTNLNEAQVSAALSFHWNTGGIGRASWVQSFKAGKIEQAKKEFMDWKIPASIIERRQKECDLFFLNRWTGDGTAGVLQVNKPSYSPKWSSKKRVPILVPLGQAMAA